MQDIKLLLFTTNFVQQYLEINFFYLLIQQNFDYSLGITICHQKTDCFLITSMFTTIQ